MPRAYTKSGSVEKYESGQWSTPVWSGGATGSITGPDSNGNYTVNAPSGYVTKDVSPTVTCVTKYGGVSKTFGFGYVIPTIFITIPSVGIDNNPVECTVSSENLTSSVQVTLRLYCKYVNDDTRSRVAAGGSSTGAKPYYANLTQICNTYNDIKTVIFVSNPGDVIVYPQKWSSIIINPTKMNEYNIAIDTCDWGYKY